MDEPRVYKNSPFVFGLLLVMFIVLFIGIFFLSGGVGFSNLIVMIPFALMFVFLFIYVTFTATAQTIISNDEISTKNLLGTKTMKWSEINRVSGRGSRIKMHNFDGDVTLAPSPQLPGYPEVIEWIGARRPDLFDPQEYGEMTRSWFVLTPLILVVAMFIAILVGTGIFFIQSPERPGFLLVPLFFILIPIAVFSGIIFSSPQSITIDDKSLLVNFILARKTISADQINLIELSYQQSRNGKSYFIVIRLKENKTIKISLPLNLSLPVVYLVLRNWHKKNATSRAGL